MLLHRRGNPTGIGRVCSGVIYTQGRHEMKVFFRQTNARVPVLQRAGGNALVKWGRRKSEPGILPMGAKASLESIKRGAWDEYQIKAVRLPLLSFQEQDIEGNYHWFALTAGQCIQGLLAKLGTEQRVYIVTLLPQCSDSLYENWPRILNLL